MKEKAKKNRFITDILENIGQMPATMKKLGVVQFFSWFAFFTMWSMANPALTEHVFKTPAPIASIAFKNKGLKINPFNKGNAFINNPIIVPIGLSIPAMVDTTGSNAIAPTAAAGRQAGRKATAPVIRKSNNNQDPCDDDGRYIPGHSST